MESRNSPERFRANRNVRLIGRSWVYFAQRWPDGPVKIGRTRQLSERMAALRATQPEEIRLIGQLPETDISEDRVHACFIKHRIRGEWFHPAPEILELAAAGERIYAAGYCREIPDALTLQWLIIRQYADRPRIVDCRPSAAEAVSRQLEKIMGGIAQ